MEDALGLAACICQYGARIGRKARLRDTEEAIKLLAMEQRHARDLESMEREKLILQLQQEFAKLKELPVRGRKKK